MHSDESTSIERAKSEPPVIVHLRERLARAEGSPGYEGRPIATLVGRGLTKALGVRGVKVGENPDGTSVFLYDETQVRRILAKWEA